jgi:hypothetical protein
LAKLPHQPTTAQTTKQVLEPVPVPTTMSSGELINKSVRFGPSPKASAKEIRQLKRTNGNLGKTLLDIYSCCERAKRWDKLTPTEHMMLESRWTDLMLMLLFIGNTSVMHNLRYKLREQTPEEDELEDGI